MTLEQAQAASLDLIELVQKRKVEESINDQLDQISLAFQISNAKSEKGVKGLTQQRNKLLRALKQI